MASLNNKKDGPMRPAALVFFFVLLLLPAQASAKMSISFEWGPTKSCFDSNSPPIRLSGVPAGTVKLDIRMVDLNARSYNLGGGRVDDTGQSELPYGAFRYKGPCPPETHTYEFTVKALDAAGKTLDTARRALP
jgi:phosphatidylethanolamine-binding protein (PEBP) family uncharacterized protein